MTRIAVLDDYQNVALETADWSRLGPDAQVDVFQNHLADEGDLAERLRDYEIVVGMRERTPFQRSLLERLPNLRLLITTGMGNASFDMNAAADLGITVCGTGGLPYPTAELTWALILALLRKVPEEDRATREGSWQVSLGEGLQGKTLGMMGLGRLGSQVATVGNDRNAGLLAEVAQAFTGPAGKGLLDDRAWIGVQPMLASTPTGTSSPTASRTARTRSTSC